MSLYNDIHAEQARLAMKRQPSLRYVHHSLVAQMEAAGHGDPFDIHTMAPLLSTSNEWRLSPSLCCCVPAPSTAYRIVPMRSLFGATGLKWIKGFDPKRFATEGALRAFLANLPHSGG